MSAYDPRVDAYIAKSAEFARPILVEIRRRVHVGCPEIVEAIKWGMPTFLYKGKLFAGMAAFKAHCAFGFWHVAMRKRGSGDAMGQFGRITNVADLGSAAAFDKLTRRAKRLADERVASPRKPKMKRVPLKVPADFRKALSALAKAREVFENFSYSHRKEYIQWITEAKRAETRARRIALAVELIAAGKSQNWKYERR